MATPRLSSGITLTWNSDAVVQITDVGYEGDAQPQDATNQLSGGWRNFIAGILKEKFPFTIQWDEADSVHVKLGTDFESGAKRGAVITLPSSMGSTVFTMTSALITNFQIGASLGRLQTAELTLEVDGDITQS